MALAGEWVNKLWSIHAMEYYSAIKRSELIIHYAEKGQVDKEYVYMKLQNTQTKFIVTEIRDFLKSRAGVGNYLEKSRKEFFGVMNMFYFSAIHDGNVS